MFARSNIWSDGRTDSKIEGTENVVSWIEETSAGTPFEAVLGQRPELLDRYRAFYQTFWEDGLVPGRLGKPDDIAKAVAFLAGDEAS